MVNTTSKSGAIQKFRETYIVTKKQTMEVKKYKIDPIMKKLFKKPVVQLQTV